MLGGNIVGFVLSQIFSLYFIIKALLMFSRSTIYRRKILQAEPDSSIILLAATIGMILGMLLIGAHNRWDLTPYIYLTVMCWLVLILSLLWLFTPERMLMWTKKLYAGKGYYFLNAAMAIAGLIFFFRGVYVYGTGTMDFIFHGNVGHLLHVLHH